MTQDTFRLQGAYSIRPAAQELQSSADFSIEADLDIQIPITFKLSQYFQLAADGAIAVPMGLITLAAIVIIKADGPMTLRTTSVDGTSQAVGVDHFYMLISQTKQVTAMTLQRPAGTLTNVRVVLAQL